MEDESVSEQIIFDADFKKIKEIICQNCWVDYDFNMADAKAEAEEFRR